MSLQYLHLQQTRKCQTITQLIQNALADQDHDSDWRGNKNNKITEKNTIIR